MIELRDNLWRFYGLKNPRHVICITTNGFIKKDGTAVMGRGCANEARSRIPGIAKILGLHIKFNGNVAAYLTPDVISFPVKHAWYEPADLALIEESTSWLYKQAALNPETRFVLPRPGCGNGQLSYTQVRPLLVHLPDNVGVIDFK
jgi:hypothetical protein